REAVGVDEHADAVLFEHTVVDGLLARHLDAIAPARTAGALDPETQAERARLLREEVLDALDGAGGEADGHDGRLRIDASIAGPPVSPRRHPISCVLAPIWALSRGDSRHVSGQRP